MNVKNSGYLILGAANIELLRFGLNLLFCLDLFALIYNQLCLPYDLTVKHARA